MAAAAIRVLCVLGLLFNATGQITVVSPPELAAQMPEGRGQLSGSTATFGAPFYGERILGQVMWVESTGHHYCNDDDYDVNLPEVGADRYINILMVKRGACALCQKVRVAQGKGAHAVIIVDSDDSSWTA